MIESKEDFSGHVEELEEQHDVIGQIFGSSANGFGTVPQGKGLYDDDRKTPLGKRVKSNFNLCFWSTIGGLGMFVEAYYILGFGNIRDVWKADETMANCYTEKPEDYNPDLPACNENLVASLNYLNYAAMMIGMLTFGYFADKFGRRWGSTTNVSILLVGAILGTAASGHYLNGEIAMFLVGMFVIGYAVGGEYPLAAASAAERAEKMKETAPHVRGKGIAFTFAMQGIGNLAADLVLLVLLAIFGCSQSTKTDFVCSSDDLNAIWRLIYGLGLVPVLGLVVGRFLFLKESEVWKKDQDRRNKRVQEGKADIEKPRPEGTSDVEQKGKFGLLLKHYWHRLVGTALGWLVWDFVYYGTKSYNGQVVTAVLNGEDPSLWAKVTVTIYGQIIQCIGYYLAALVVDKPWVGRTRLQALGFAMIMILEFIGFIWWDQLIQPANTWALMLVYFMSGFFQQFGPNTTTWLLPAELFPTELRTLSHGISAGTGKFGAILSGVVFSYANGGKSIETRTIFLLSGISGVIGVLLTVLFIPDVTRLDLAEQDRRWAMISEGREDEYDGEAINPQYLSLYERLTGVGRNYRENK